jgi:DNA polymerase III sliding clamp (beta) subunit (PCNA family)
MFEAIIPIENEKYFSTIWKMLPNLALEAQFTVTKDGIVIKGMDPAQTTMVIIELPKEFFSSIKVDEPLSFFCDVLHLSKLIKARGEQVRLQGDEDVLTVEHFGGKKFKKRTFKSINLKGINVTYPNLNLERETTLAIESDCLQQLLEDAVPVADTVYFRVDESGLKVGSEGEISSMEEELEFGSSLQKIKGGTIQRAEYFHEYIREVIDSLYSLIEWTYISISEGKPLVLVMAATTEDKKSIIFKTTAVFGPKP